MVAVVLVVLEVIQRKIRRMVQMVPAMEESAYNPTSAEPCNITAAAAVAEVKLAKVLLRAMVALEAGGDGAPGTGQSVPGAGSPNTGGGGGGVHRRFRCEQGRLGHRHRPLQAATCSDQSCGTNYYHDGSDCVACPTGSTRMPETANQCLCPENHHRSVDGGVYSCAACAQGSTRLPGDTVPGGDATTCTSSVSPPPPPPSAQALEKVAEETRDSILDDIADED